MSSSTSPLNSADIAQDCHASRGITRAAACSNSVSRATGMMNLPSIQDSLLARCVAYSDAAAAMSIAAGGNSPA